VSGTLVAKKAAPPFRGFERRGLIPCRWQVDAAGKTCGRASEFYWNVEVRKTNRNYKLGLHYTKVRQPLCIDHAGCRTDYADANVRSWIEAVDPKYAGAEA
jgi:hypothetical protein